MDGTVDTPEARKQAAEVIYNEFGTNAPYGA